MPVRTPAATILSIDGLPYPTMNNPMPTTVTIAISQLATVIGQVEADFACR